MTRMSLPAFCLAISLVLSAGCDFRGSVSSRSGTVKDDYVEEPLSGKVTKYESALKVSNAMLEGIRAGRYGAVYAQHFDPQWKKTFPEAQFVAMVRKVESYVGPLKQYKPMQWGFVTRDEDGDKLLISTKIVEHEKGMVRYHFAFIDDGRYEKLFGLRMTERTGVEAPGQ